MGNCCSKNQSLPQAMEKDHSIHLVCDESLLRSTFKGSLKLAHYEETSINNQLSIIIDENSDEDLTKANIERNEKTRTSLAENSEEIS
ncbi:unnamed protein product [Blepharisma stoltei]|uniref:Uncharacterized protein n=1 Tax=Blepharisma stoltei TaxID=1481888 RepID=A0AAU9ILW5_9CILI|nr:unnamed protein product [Blepharisma stoltei]